MPDHLAAAFFSKPPYHAWQFGFALPDLEMFEAGNGVGDDLQSWAVDGHRQCKWHGGQEVFGSRWRAGDVIGLAYDLGEACGDGSGEGSGGDVGGGGGAILVSVNGDFGPPNGLAFALPSGLSPLRPALTAMSGRFRCRLRPPFRHAPPP